MNKEIKHIKILEFDKPTPSGRIYNEDLFKDIPENVFGIIGGSQDLVEIGRITHMFNNFEIKEGCLFGDLTVFENTPMGAVLMSLSIESLEPYVVGIGKMNQKVVEEYKLLNINFRLKNE